MSSSTLPQFFISSKDQRRLPVGQQYSLPNWLALFEKPLSFLKVPNFPLRSAGKVSKAEDSHNLDDLCEAVETNQLLQAAKLARIRPMALELILWSSARSRHNHYLAALLKALILSGSTLVTLSIYASGHPD